MADPVGPPSDKTSRAVGAPPNMKMGYRAINRLFAVEVEAIFIAEDLSGFGSTRMKTTAGKTKK